ncbi:primase-helicase zinc-binding domain-containing protein [Paracoccus sp. SM22M-07]|uniref:DUF7146 domain-containing protein n=1 Tax=Paracoccus sp. SM22M-07 TaxID=1520813 RepID=UPI00090FAD7C|nr:primase-helicase zinc-binding domain-containing protein [Paracoccus sp. SM22M-07]OJH46157.1 hypothetical protein IE00_02795 [Paracoccus sp. SM22M-07]
MADDPRILEAHRIPMLDLVDRLAIGGLKRAGGELVGPCPGCGGTDRFSINTQKGVMFCRRCDAKGDQIALVQLVMGMEFPAALEWLVGARQELTPAQRAEQARKAAEHRRAREADAARHRQDAIALARKIWSAARPADGTLVADYLDRRGIRQRPGAQLPRCFRFEPEARLVVPDEQRRGAYVSVHEGPAMLSAILDAQGDLTGVHRTWIDLGQPKGKVVAYHPAKAGEMVPSKKVYGSKKGGAIRIFTPRDASVMVMAEGIETTLSAMVAAAIDGRAAYWAGVDLGNMAGARKLGPGLKFAGLPDMTDRDAFVPPAWVRRLVFVQDGDSDPRLTRAKLLSGLRRAKALRPGLTAAIVHPGEGIDMNDLLMSATDVTQREGDE